MKKILVLLVALLMVGCEAKDPEKPKQIIEKAVKQEQQVEQPKEEPKQKQQVDKPKEEVKEEPKKEVKQVEKELPKKIEPKKEVPKKTVKESPKKEQPKKKEQNDNIDPETGLAKIKDGTHLEEEAKKQVEEGIIEQEKEGIIEPEEEYNEPDYDDDWLREYGNTEEFGDYDDYSGENEYN